MKIHIPSELSNEELLAGAARCARGERENAAHLVAQLVEIETRGLHLGAGFPSLFAYCCEVLRLSEDAAYNRIEAARAARRFPVLLEMLADGALSVTTARLVGKILTPENSAELLVAAAAGQGKRVVEDLVARFAPRPDVPTSVRKVPVRTVASSPAPTEITTSATLALAGSVRAAPPPERPTRVTPLAPSRYELKVTLSDETREKLRLAQDLLCHAVPSGDAAEVLDRALTLLLADLARRKCAATTRPAPGRGVANSSRHIAAEVKRAVWQRDLARCAYVSSGGQRCGARAFLEFHHVKPYAAGGDAATDNIELRCRAHNQYEASLFFRVSRDHSTRSGTS